MLKTEEAWGKKYQTLVDSKKEEDLKKEELEKSVKLKESMLADLKKELEDLKTSVEKNKSSINNSAAHFDTEMTETPQLEQAKETLPVVAATASNERAPASGIESLFDFRPRSNWRSAYPDPGPVSKVQE